MILAILGVVFGSVLGAVLGGPLGAGLGCVLGAMIGIAWNTRVEAVERAPAGAHLVREPHDLLCVPKGQVATATFVRNADDGHWLDVERCSLCTPEDQVTCQKRCLMLMRDAVPARKNPVMVGA